MENSENNPASNQLGKGLSEEQLEEAVRRSGYPLQTIIADSLRGDFYVRDEWCFKDSDSNTLRNIDILAEKRLYSVEESGKKVRPVLSLLIECKQSDLPYVFFLSKRPSTPYFPLVTGLFNENIQAVTDDDPSTWNFTIMNALGLEKEEFRNGNIPACMSFTKAVRKGNSIELTGKDAFNSLVLPLVKSLQYHQSHYAPPKNAMYHDCRLSLGVAVIDAPMVGVEVDNGSHTLINLPWVRVYRSEVFDGEHSADRERVFAFDVVHKDYFKEYIESCVLPFAELFSERALQHHIELATGKAFVEGLESKPWPSRLKLEPRSYAPIKRSTVLIKHVLRLFNK